ncbi:MAG: ComEC/Rec2 family competence protein [Flavobacteriaceae bacterium]
MFNQHSIHLGLVLLGYSLGIAWGFYDTPLLETSWTLKIGLGIGLLLLVFFSRKEAGSFWVFCFLVSGYLGLLRLELLPSLHHPNLQAHAKKQILLLQLQSPLKSSPSQIRFEALAYPVKDNRLLPPERLILTKARDSIAISWEIGNFFWTQGYLSVPGAPRVPGGFNYRSYLKTKGIHFQWYVTASTPLKGKEKTVLSWKKRIQSYREKLLLRIKKSGIDPQAFEVYAALLFGDKKDLDAARLSAYQNAGAAHILAISGLHIGIITAILWGLLWPLRKLKSGRFLSGAILMAALWAYAAFSGFSPSVIRAVSMFSFLSLSLMINRPQYSIQLLGVAYLANLLWDPLSLFSLGFAMSYSAVFFILLGMPFFKEIWTPKNNILQFFWQLLGVSICAQLGVLPWSLYAFNQLPLLFLISNLIILPFLGLILGAGLGLAIWFALANPPRIIIQSYAWILGALNLLVYKLAKQQQWILTDLYFPKRFLWATIVVSLCILAFLYPYKRKKYDGKFLFLGGFILSSVWLAEFHCNKGNQAHYMVSDHGKTALVLLGNNKLFYWSSDPLSNTSLRTLKRNYPYKDVVQDSLSKAFVFKGKYLVWSPQGPNILKSIDYMLIDSQTKAYPEDFATKQLEKTQFILSSYSQSKQMHQWEKWLQKNARPAWRLDAHGYYRFHEP